MIDKHLLSGLAKLRIAADGHYTALTSLEAQRLRDCIMQGGLRPKEVEYAEEVGSRRPANPGQTMHPSGVSTRRALGWMP